MSGASLKLRHRQTGKKIELSSNILATTTQTFTLPSASGVLARESDYTAVLNKYKDSLGKSISCIYAPAITYPIDNAVNIYGTLTAGPYRTVDNYDGKHLASQWQFATDEYFNNIVKDSGMDYDNLLSITFNPSLYSTRHYMRVRYFSDEFVSNWSPVVSFISRTTVITPPKITTTENITKTSLKPTFNAGEFTVINGTDDLMSTTWQIAKDIGMNNLVIEKTLDTVNLYTLTLTDKLDLNTTYYVRAMFNGSKLSSAWSEVLEFKTANKTDTPILNSTASVNENTTLSIKIANYDSNVSYFITTSIGSYNVNLDTISWTLPKVNADVPASLSIYGVDTVNGLDQSEIATLDITILDVPMVSDQAILYNATNIKNCFLQTDMSTSENTLAPINNSVLDMANVSTVNKVFVNNILYEAMSGDMLITGTGERFTVDSVGSDNTTAINGSKSYKPNYWVIPSAPLTAIPTEVYLVNNRGVSEPIIQDTADKDFSQVFTTTIKEVPTNILNDNKVSATNKIYINNKILEVKPGQILLTGDGNYITVQSVNDDNVLSSIAIKAIAAGANHTAAIGYDGYLYVSGDNTYGQLGIIGLSRSQVFTKTNIKALAVACGDYTTYAIRENFEVFGTGKGDSGQFGDGLSANRTTFKSCNAFATEIAAGGENIIIKALDGYAYTCGSNAFGQVGNNSLVNQPTWYGTGIKAKGIFCGRFNIALTSADYTVYTSGKNDFFQATTIDAINPFTTYTGTANQTVMTSSGSYTVPANVYNVKVTVIGGGAGGGAGGVAGGGGPTYAGGGGGGGSGAMVVSNLSVTPGSVLTIVVGSGGNGGVIVPDNVYPSGTILVGGSGNNGGESRVTYGSKTVVASGGNGGKGGTGGTFVGSQPGGAGGIGGTTANVGSTDILETATKGNDGAAGATSGAGTYGNGFITGTYGRGGSGGQGGRGIWNNEQASQGGNAGNSGAVIISFNSPVNSNPIKSFTPISQKAKQVAFGDGHIALIGTDDYVYVCGKNTYGQLGLSNTTNITSLTKTSQQAKDIKAASEYTMIIDMSDYVNGTGYNGFGQLALGTLNSVNTFTKGTQKAKSLAVGYYSAIITDMTDLIKVVGLNTSYQLGLNDATNRTSFTSTTLGLKAPKDKLYRDNYWIVPTVAPAKVPTSLYAISSIKFNNKPAVPVSTTITSTLLTTTFETLDLSFTRSIVTTVDTPKSSIVTEIAASLYKIK